LAHLLRLGLLPEGYIFPQELRAVRDLARKRMQLVHYRTAQILAIENIMIRETGGRISSGKIKTMATETVEALGLMPDVTLAMESSRVVCQALQQQIEVLKKRLEAQVKLQSGYQLIKTIPGIGQVMATTIMLEAGPMTRFADVGNFSS
jgi:transposase